MIGQYSSMKEAEEKHRFYRELSEEEFKAAKSFWYNYDSNDMKFGDYILFQHIKPLWDGERNKAMISTPIYGIFLQNTVQDRALTTIVVESPRAWRMWGIIIPENNPMLDYPTHLVDIKTEPFKHWTGNIQILGRWKNRPTFSELREAYNKKI